MTDAAYIASYDASPLHLPAALRGVITISCRRWTGDEATTAELAQLCAVAGAAVTPAMIEIPAPRKVMQLELF